MKQLFDQDHSHLDPVADLQLSLRTAGDTISLRNAACL